MNFYDTAEEVSVTRNGENRGRGIMPLRLPFMYSFSQVRHMSRYLKLEDIIDTTTNSFSIGKGLNRGKGDGIVFILGLDKLH